jgi:NTE family protein
MDLSHIKNIMLSGGSIKGIMHLGALMTMTMLHGLSLSNIESYSGSSIGSVLCVLLSINFTPEEIFERFYHNDTYKAQLYKSYSEMAHSIALANPDPFFEFIKSMILEKMQNIPTMYELEQFMGVNVNIIGTNLSKMERVVFNAENQPTLSVMDAMRMSCSLPFLFPKRSYNEFTFVDGSLMDNVPWDTLKDIHKPTLALVIESSYHDDIINSFDDYTMRILMAGVKSHTRLKMSLCPDNIKVYTLTDKKRDTDMLLSLFLSGMTPTPFHTSKID